MKALRLDAFAERFRNAGYACLVFDYRHFGDSSGEPRELLAIDRQLEDWRAAVAFARCLPECDADRVILWGTSFAGGHVTITAADDPRIAAVIAQNPFTDGRASAMTLNVKSVARVTALALRDLAARRLGAAPVRVASVAQPGEAGLMTAADAMRGYEAMAEASDWIPRRRWCRRGSRCRSSATSPGAARRTCAARSCTPSARPTASRRPGHHEMGEDRAEGRDPPL